MWKTVSEEEMKIIKDALKRNFSGYRYECGGRNPANFTTLNSNGIREFCKWWTSYEISETMSCAFSSNVITTGIVDCNSEYNKGENNGMGLPVRCILVKKW